MAILGRAAKRNRQCGFSLIEVLVALAMFSILVFPLMAMFTTSLRTVDSGRAQVTAAFHAQAQMDAFISARARGVPPPTPGAIDHTYSFTRTESVHSPGLTRVEITVSWVDRGRNRTLKVVSLVAP